MRITRFIDINSHSEHNNRILSKPSWNNNRKFSSQKIFLASSTLNLSRCDVDEILGAWGVSGRVRMRGMLFEKTYNVSIFLVASSLASSAMFNVLRRWRCWGENWNHDLHKRLRLRFDSLGTFSAIASLCERRPPEITWLAPFSSFAWSRFAAASRCNRAKPAMVMALWFFCFVYSA